MIEKNGTENGYALGALCWCVQRRYTTHLSRPILHVQRSTFMQCARYYNTLEQH